jgi:molybdate transport system substrate-binding protein
MGKLVQSLKAGDPADMVIVTTEVLPSLQLQGKAIARVGIGVAVNEKAPSPDISTVEAFKQTLLAGEVDRLHRPQGRHQRQACRGNT